MHCPAFAGTPGGGPNIGTPSSPPSVEGAIVPDVAAVPEPAPDDAPDALCVPEPPEVVPDDPDALIVPEFPWVPDGIVEPLVGAVAPLVAPLEELPDSWPLAVFE